MSWLHNSYSERGESELSLRVSEKLFVGFSCEHLISRTSDSQKQRKDLTFNRMENQMCTTPTGEKWMGWSSTLVILFHVRGGALKHNVVPNAVFTESVEDLLHLSVKQQQAQEDTLWQRKRHKVPGLILVEVSCCSSAAARWNDKHN